MIESPFQEREEHGASIIIKISLFTRLLRDNGIIVTTPEFIDAVSAVALIDLTNRPIFLRTLKTTLVKRLSDSRLFDDLFRQFWLEMEEVSTSNEVQKKSTGKDDMSEPGYVDKVATPESRLSLIEQYKQDNEQEKSRSPTDISYYSYLATMNQRKRLPSQVIQSEISKMSRNLGRLISNLKLRPSRRYVFSADGRINIRRTLRSNSSTGWEIVKIVRTARKRKHPDMILLCDVSGSMSQYNSDLETLILSSCAYSSRVHVYCFSTILEEINERIVREKIKSNSTDLLFSMDSRLWGSGTRIGEILSSLLDCYRQYLKRRSVVIIASDGLDCGDTSLLASKMHELSQRTGRIIWLNPLADSPTFRPIAKGMQAALPYINTLHGFASLKR